MLSSEQVKFAYPSETSPSEKAILINGSHKSTHQPSYIVTHIETSPHPSVSLSFFNITPGFFWILSRYIDALLMLVLHFFHVLLVECH